MARAPRYGRPARVELMDGGARVRVESYSTANSFHSVTRKGGKYRCTCKRFIFQTKVGPCHHILTAIERGLAAQLKVAA